MKKICTLFCAIALALCASAGQKFQRTMSFQAERAVYLFTDPVWLNDYFSNSTSGLDNIPSLSEQVEIVSLFNENSDISGKRESAIKASNERLAKVTRASRHSLAPNGFPIRKNVTSNFVYNRVAESGVAPEAQEIDTIAVYATNLKASYIPSYDETYLIAYNDDTFVELWAEGDITGIDGSINDYLEPSYCYVTYEDKDYYMNSADLVHTLSPDSIYGYFTSTSGTVFKLDLANHPQPIEKTRDETIVSNNGKLREYSDFDFFIVSGNNDDNTRHISLYFMGSTITGDFSIEEGTIDVYSSYVDYLDAENNITNSFAPISADFNISIDQQGDTIITGTMLAMDIKDDTDIPEFHITLTLPYQGTTPPVAMDTISVAATSYRATYYASSQDWYITIGDGDNALYYFDIFAPESGVENGKTYTSENGDFDMYFTYAINDSGSFIPTSVNFTKTEDDDELLITAEMITADNTVYEISYYLDKTVEIVDEYGIITQPARGRTINYNRLATNTSFYVKSPTTIGLTYQSGTATMVECEDGTVYWKDPVCYFSSGTWIKGKKEGTTITFPTKQPVYYNANAAVTMSMRWGYFTGINLIALDDHAENFVFDIVEDSLIMRGTAMTTGATATYFMGIFMDDNNDFCGYGDCGVNLYVPGWQPATELITPPAGLVATKMPFTASGSSDEYADSVLVGWDGSDVYIKGLCTDNFKNAWIKGTLDNGVVTFDMFQYVGKYSNYQMWAVGSNSAKELEKFTMQYDAEHNLFTSDNYLAINASYEKLYYLELFKNIVIGEPAEIEWGEWEDFAPFGFNTGSWTYTVATIQPEEYINYVAMVRSDKNNDDRRQIKITNWGKSFFTDNGTELIIDWNAKTNECSIGRQSTGCDLGEQYGFIYVVSVEDGTYDPESTTFSLDVKYYYSSGSFGHAVEKFVMDQTKPKMAGDTKDIPFNAEFSWHEMYVSNQSGIVTITALNNDNQYLDIELYVEEDCDTVPAGVYDINDSGEIGTVLVSEGIDEEGYIKPSFAGILNDEGYVDDIWFMVSGTVSIEYDQFGKMNVAITSKNSYEMDINATIRYEKVEPKDTVRITDASFGIYEEDHEEYGVYGYFIQTDSFDIELYAYSDTLYGDFRDSAELSYCGIYKTDGSELSILDIEEFSAYADGKEWTLNAKVLASDTILYDITATCYYGAIEGDAQEDFISSFNLSDAIVTFSKSATILDVSNEAGDSIKLVFLSSELFNRTYDINDSGSKNTVAASSTTLMINVSFAARTMDGMITKLWHMVSGTVVIDEDGNITVDALNSYDKAVKFTINAPDPGQGDEPTTSVDPVIRNAEDTIFSISGQRITEPQKGNVYIINGQQTLFE